MKHMYCRPMELQRRFLFVDPHSSIDLTKARRSNRRRLEDPIVEQVNNDYTLDPTLDRRTDQRKSKKESRQGKSNIFQCDLFNLLDSSPNIRGKKENLLKIGSSLQSENIFKKFQFDRTFICRNLSIRRICRQIFCFPVFFDEDPIADGN